MSAIRLLSLVPALIASLPLVAADPSTGLVDRVVPAYGVRYGQPFRMPSRIDPQISQARTFLTQVNAKLLGVGAGAGAGDLAAISTWQQDLAKLTRELTPGLSVYERQQLDVILDELERAGESIALLTAQAAPLAPRIEFVAPVAPVAPSAPAPLEVENPAPAPRVPVAELVEAPVAAPEASAEVPAMAPMVEMPNEVPVEVPVEVPSEVPVEVPAPESIAPAVEAAAPAEDATTPELDATIVVPTVDAVPPTAP